MVQAGLSSRRRYRCTVKNILVGTFVKIISTIHFGCPTKSFKSLYQSTHVESSMPDNPLDLPLNMLSFSWSSDVVVSKSSSQASDVPWCHAVNNHIKVKWFSWSLDFSCSRLELFSGPLFSWIKIVEFDIMSRIGVRHLFTSIGPQVRRMVLGYYFKNAMLRACLLLFG